MNSLSSIYIRKVFLFFSYVYYERRYRDFKDFVQV